jgi:nicotinamide-nucleotide amidase
MLGVPQVLLTEHGAVSEPVARAMAEGALAASDADIAVAVTGVAGPGASEKKPEGLVWFAVATAEETVAERRDFGPLGRDAVRVVSVETALDLLLQALVRTP